MPILLSESKLLVFDVFVDLPDRRERSVEELLFLCRDCGFGGHGLLRIMPRSRGVKSKCWPRTLSRSFWLYGIQMLIHRVCSSGGRGAASNLEYACASRSNAPKASSSPKSKQKFWLRGFRVCLSKRSKFRALSKSRKQCWTLSSGISW